MVEDCRFAQLLEATLGQKPDSWAKKSSSLSSFARNFSLSPVLNHS